MLLKQVEAYIVKNRLILPEETVIIGFSGGPDSLCLSHLLWRLSEKHGWKLILAHFDHQLRGSFSQEDAAFCKAWAESMAIPFFSAAADIVQEARLHAESTELAARRCRYAFFSQLQADTGAKRIALGHHRDDQAETVLMRLIRGTGTDGLAGMRPLREDGVIRPLLAQSRQDILAYCEAEALAPRMDHTNLEDAYTRNALRLEVLPLLAARYNPGIAETLCRTAALAAEDSDCLNDLARQQLSDWGTWQGAALELPVDRLVSAPAAIVKRMLRQGVRQIAGSAENLAAEHLERVLQLAEKAQTGKYVYFCGVRFSISYGKLVLSKAPEGSQEPEIPLPMAGGTVHGFGGRITVRRITPDDWKRQQDRGPGCIVIDGESLGGMLRARKRQDGDRMIPLGMSGFKKLKDLLIDQKIPRDHRDRIPVFWDGEKIVWLAGIRMDERVRVKESSKILLEICWEVCCSPC